jgi:hypothetical protein
MLLPRVEIVASHVFRFNAPMIIAITNNTPLHAYKTERLGWADTSSTA